MCLKKHETVTDNHSISIYINKIERQDKIKAGYYFESLKPGKIKLRGSTKSKITKEEYGKNVPHLEITEVVLIHCNIFNNNYHQHSRTLYTFVPNRSFGQLLDISPGNYIFSKTFNSTFSYIEVWFLD